MVDGRIVAGVCAGLAQHMRVDVRWVRALFIATAVLGKGAGLLAYLAFWALLPLDPHEAPTARPAPRARESLLAIAFAGVAGVLAMAALGFTSFLDSLVPLILGSIGIALVWSRADEMQRQTWRSEAAGMAREAASGSSENGVWRAIVGVAAVIAAIVSIALTRVGVATMVQGLATTTLLVFGLVLVAFPWIHARWLRFMDERAARARADERADMAARIHDSVLQTLTLVQRHAGDAQRVQQLARAGERELRGWLYGDARSASSLGAALQRAAEDVEARHGVSIEVVLVGDAPVDSRIEALLAAAQEAMVNAAKHSGVSVAQVYAEVEPETVSVFIRDRGRGFAPEEVADDRAGVRDSITGRMERAGGVATVRSLPGQGTEVALSLPRSST